MTISWKELQKLIETQNSLTSGNPLCGEESQIFMEEIQRHAGFIPSDRRSGERRMFARIGPDRRVVDRRLYQR